MLAQADLNDTGSLSKQHEKTKMVDSTVHFQRFKKCKFQKFPGDSPRIVWRLQHKKHRTLVPLVQSPASISLFGKFKTSVTLHANTLVLKPS